MTILFVNKMLRVGKVTYTNHGTPIYPEYDGFTPFIVMMKSHSGYHVLSPYELVDDKGRIMENVWQFSKVYHTVPKTTQKYSRYDDTVIWKHDKETHLDANDKINDLYKAWRKKGMWNPYSVRYPVGYASRGTCRFALAENLDGTINENEKLDYIHGRKKIYVKLYCDLVKQHPVFHTLQQRLLNGENLLILEVDGPCENSLNYYKQKYNVGDNFIEDGTMLVNQQNIQIMLNDAKHPFGHGYCLAMALLNKDVEWNI